jgi:hypothetical protein
LGFRAPGVWHPDASNPASRTWRNRADIKKSLINLGVDEFMTGRCHNGAFLSLPESPGSIKAAVSERRLVVAPWNVTGA